eukprot:g19791.t1
MVYVYYPPSEQNDFAGMVAAMPNVAGIQDPAVLPLIEGMIPAHDYYSSAALGGPLLENVGHGLFVPKADLVPPVEAAAAPQGSFLMQYLPTGVQGGVPYFGADGVFFPAVGISPEQQPEGEGRQTTAGVKVKKTKQTPGDKKTADLMDKIMAGSTSAWPGKVKHPAGPTAGNTTGGAPATGAPKSEQETETGIARDEEPARSKIMGIFSLPLRASRGGGGPRFTVAGGRASAVLFVLATTSTSNSCIFTAEGVVVLTGTTHMNENENADLQLVAAQEVDDTGDVFLAAPTTTTANRHDRDQASWSSRPGSVLEHRHQQREKMNVNVMTKPFRLFQQEQAAQPADDSGSSGGGGGFFGSFGGGKKRGDGENNVLEGIVNSADSNGENPSTGNMAEQGQEPGGGNKIVPEEIMKSDLDEGYPTRLEAEQEANKAVLEKAATVDQSLAREDKLGHDGDNIQDVDAIVNLAGGQQGSDHVPPDATELSDGLPGEYVFTPREEPRKERGDKTQQEARGLRGLAGRLLSMFRRKPKELEDDHKNSTSTALVLRGGGEMVEQDSPRRRWWSPWGWVKRNGICQKCQQVWTLLRHTLFNPAYKGGKIKLVGYIFVVSAAILMEDMIYGFAMAMTLNAIGGMSLGVLTIAKVVELAPWIIGAYTAGSYCAARRTQLVEYVEMQITQQLRQFVTDVASQDQLTDTKDIAKADRSVLKIAELVSQDGVSAIAGTAAFAGGMMALVRGVGIGAMAVPMLAQVGVAMATFEIPILDNRVNDAYNEREEAMNELYLANLPFKETVQRAALLTNARHSKHVNALVAKAQKRVTEADNRYNRLKTVRDTIQGFFHYLAVPLTMFSLLRGKIAPKQAQSTFQGLQVLGSRAGSTMIKSDSLP